MGDEKKRVKVSLSPLGEVAVRMVEEALSRMAERMDRDEEELDEEDELEEEDVIALLSDGVSLLEELRGLARDNLKELKELRKTLISLAGGQLAGGQVKPNHRR